MKNLSIKLKRGISTFLCASMLFLCSISGVNAQATDTKATQDTSSKSISLQSLSEETIAMVDEYVNVDNGQYVLKLPDSVSEKLTPAELELVKESINKANDFIVLNKNKVVYNEDEKEYAVTVSDSELKNNSSESANQQKNRISTNSVSNGTILTTGGETKVLTHWWGLSIFLSSSMVRSLALGEVAGIAALIALIPGAGWSVGAAIAGTIAGDWAAGQTYPPCVIQMQWSAIAGVKPGVNFYTLPQIVGFDYSDF